MGADQYSLAPGSSWEEPIPYPETTSSQTVHLRDLRSNPNPGSVTFRTSIPHNRLFR